MKNNTGISNKWANLAISFVGNSSGRHCHWCKFIILDEYEAVCGNKLSEFADGERIRTWDGEGCAKNCDFFELNDWYKDDKNFYKFFENEDLSNKEIIDIIYFLIDKNIDRNELLNFINDLKIFLYNYPKIVIKDSIIFGDSSWILDGG